MNVISWSLTSMFVPNSC